MCDYDKVEYCSRLLQYSRFSYPSLIVQQLVALLNCCHNRNANTSRNRYSINRRSPRTAYDDSRMQHKASVDTEASFL